MKFKVITVVLCPVVTGSFADLVNVAENATVTWNGDFFTEYLNWSTGCPDGSPVRQVIYSLILLLTVYFSLNKLNGIRMPYGGMNMDKSGGGNDYV